VRPGQTFPFSLHGDEGSGNHLGLCSIFAEFVMSCEYADFFAQCGNAMELWRIVELVVCFKNK
jgi:hypothetical protein